MTRSIPLRRAAIRAPLNQGTRYWTTRGEPLDGEDEILRALERDHSVVSRSPAEVRFLAAPMADAEDGEDSGLFPSFL